MLIAPCLERRPEPIMESLVSQKALALIGDASPHELEPKGHNSYQIEWFKEAQKFKLVLCAVDGACAELLLPRDKLLKTTKTTKTTMITTKKIVMKVVANDSYQDKRRRSSKSYTPFLIRFTDEDFSCCYNYICCCLFLKCLSSCDKTCGCDCGRKKNSNGHSCSS